MKKILVVDDEQDLCFLIQKSLEKTGEYTVLTTSVPEDVINICIREKPDLILLDIVMPNVNGTEILHALRTNPQTASILIIVTSGYGEMVYYKRHDQWKWEPNRPLVHERGEVVKEHSAERAAQAYGADDFLAKPFSPQTLLTVIREIFEKAPQKKKEADIP
jgi:CheY-like chemotaxis protein